MLIVFMLGITYHCPYLLAFGPLTREHHK